MSSSNQFQQLSEQKQQIDNLLIDLNLDYINKMKSRFIDEKEPYSLARTSFMFRMRALGFHLRTMIDYLNSIPSRLGDLDYESRKMNAGPIGIHIGDEFAINVLHLFESVLFNIASLVDYTGSLVCCCFEQHNIKKWSGLKGACCNEQTLFSQLKLTNTVSKFDNEFVERLYKLRSVIIHDRNIGINRNISWNTKSGEYKVTILAPQAEVRKFSELRHIESLSLMDFTFWLLKQTFDGVEKILTDLRSDIETDRKIPAGKEVIIVK